MVKQRFSLFVAISFLAHLALFGLAVVLGPGGDHQPSRDVVQARDLRAFRESLREYAASGAAPARLANAMIGLSEEEISEAFRQAPVLDSRLTGQEKAGLYKKMLAEASVDFREGAGLRTALDEPLSRYFAGLREVPLAEPAAAFKLVRVGDALDESARLFRVSRETAQELQTLLGSSQGSGDHTASVLVQDKTGRVDSVPGEYFFRDSPYLQVVAVGAQLFYVVKGFPSLPALDFEGTANDRLRPPEPRPSQDFQVVYLKGPTPGAPAPSIASTKPALELRPGDADRILDELMKLPGDQQVRTFYRDYLLRYDADSPDLADLTSTFIYRNLGMVFILLDNPLSKGFDLLEEVYYDNLSQDELVPFALERPKTRTGTAILLALAASYEFERRVIAALDGSLGAVKEVLADPSTERYFVHNKNVKAYVLREVYQDLAAELRRRNYASLESVLQRYRDEQLAIYDYLIQLGGEARSRALYAQGRLNWDEGDAGLALTVWKGIDLALAKGAANDVRQALTGRYPVQSIDYILGREASSERIRLFERIQRFHKWDKR